MNDFDMVRAIEANIIGARRFVNFWVAREELNVVTGELSEPFILEWKVKGVDEPSAETIAQWVSQLPPAPDVIPRSVTRRQGRLALLEVGKLDQVESAVESAGMAAQIEYEADTWERSNAFLQAMWSQLGGTEEELDALFILAAEK